jgi:hypothetical protein
MAELTTQTVEDLIRTAMASLKAYGVHNYDFESQTPHDRREWLRGYSAALTVILHHMTGTSYSDITLRLNTRIEDPTR